jgi:sirohydrochlorin cobaltochelatase
MKTGLMLLAHGARAAAWAEPFESLAAGLRAQSPTTPIELAFLEWMTPDFAAASDTLVAQGCQRVAVVPCFFGGAGHVLRDVPGLLEAAQARYPQIHFVQHDALGVQPAMQRAMQAVCLQLLAQSRA